MHRGYKLAIIGFLLLPLSCWDTPHHRYEEAITTPPSDGGIDSGLVDTDTETDTDTGTEGTGQGDLPPGWEKNFVRGRRLEDPVWNRLIPVPDDLNRRIRYQQPGRYYILNDRLVRVNPDNRILLGSILLSELLD